MFDWRPDKLIGERPKWEKTLIFKNLFDPLAFEVRLTDLHHVDKFGFGKKTFKTKLVHVFGNILSIFWTHQYISVPY